MANTESLMVKKVVCEECKGEGSYHHFKDCGNCHGTGEVGPYDHDFGHNYRGQTCSNCGPTSLEDHNIPGFNMGLIYEGFKTCARCHGTGCYYIKTEDRKEAFAELVPIA